MRGLPGLNGSPVRRQRYARPVLVTYGSLRELTGSASGDHFGDGLSMAMVMSMDR